MTKLGLPELEVDGEVFALARRAASVRPCPWESADGEPVSALLLVDAVGTTTAMVPVPIDAVGRTGALARQGRLVLRRGLRRVTLPCDPQ